MFDRRYAVCYNKPGLLRPGRCFVTVGRSTPSKGVILLAPLSIEKGVVDMVTYAELFHFCLVVIGIVNLIYQIMKKK